MTLRVSISGIWKALSSVKISIGGVWKTVSSIQIYKSGALHYVYGTAPPPPPGPPPPPPPSPPPPTVLSVSISPPEINAVTRGGTTVTTSGVVASSSNGTGPFTAAWTLASWDNSTTPAPVALSPSNATTAFQKTNMNLDSNCSATFTCIMVDSLGNSGSANIDVTFFSTTYTPPIGGPYP